jgi:hypothetical protein
MKTNYRRTAWSVFGAAVFGVMLTWLPAVSEPAETTTPAQAASAEQTGVRKIPAFQVDPYWPKLPEGWLLGGGAGVATDRHDNVWVIHRPATVTEQFPCC